MNSNDWNEFASMWDSVAELHGKPATPGAKKLSFKILARYELVEIRSALEQHTLDPDRGRFMPKPADIVAKIQVSSKSEFPGAEEAWAQFPHDETQSACTTQEMNIAWGVAEGLEPIPGRMAFLETYRAEVARAKSEGRRPVWSMNLGHDPNQREEATLQAIESGRLTVERAKHHLPNYRVDELQRLANNSVSVTALLMDESRRESGNIPALIESTVTAPASQETALRELAKLQAMLGIGKKAANG